MITLALSPDLWAAYDATDGSLYKVWKGGVNFDGAVYTTVHGPQPTTEGAAFVIADRGKQVWRLTKDGAVQPTEMHYLGHRFVNYQCELHYKLTAGNTSVDVFEVPEADRGNFTRTFRIGKLPAGYGVRLESNLTTTHLDSITADSGSRVTPGAPIDFRADSTVKLTYDLGELPTSLIPGQPVLFAATSTLGGTEAPIQDPEPAPSEPGVAVRVYTIGEDMDRVPELVMGQTPNVSFVAPNIDFRNFRDFRSQVEDQFLVHVTGFITAPTTGTYEFRLSSDDGAVFSIRDTKVVDHDGLNSGTDAIGRFEMNSERHPFRIEYFESGGDEMLKLEWRKLGETEWTVVPPSAFSTPEGEVRVTSPGKKNVMVPGARWKPGDRIPLAGVHPAYDLVTIRPPQFHPRVGGIDFLPNGHMVMCTWDADGSVYELSGIEGGATNVTIKRIAAGLAEPLGIKTVGNRIFVLQKQELTELIDTDKDGYTDKYRAVANGWGVTDNFHEFAFGLAYKNGKFYATLATAINPGGASTHPQNPDRGKVVQIDEKTGKFEFIARGLRTPNGIGWGFDGKLYVCDNQGDWLPSSKLLEVIPGAFYGSYSVNPELTGTLKETPPVLWMPQGEIGNSPSEPTTMNDGPYKGQMLHGDVTHGGVKRDYVERVNGQLQGAIFRFTQGLEGGINRIHWGPDGALYVGGIGAAGNWGQEGKERFGLQKIKYNGKSVFEMLKVSSRADGFDIELTQPLGNGLPVTPDLLKVSQWRYIPTDTYGGPKVDETTLKVTSLDLSPDRKHIYAHIDGLLKGHVVYLRLDPVLQSQSKQDLWSTEAWYTLNNIATTPLPRAQTPWNYALESGFTDLSAPSNWQGWRSDHRPASWSFNPNGELKLTEGKDGGDLRTAQTYGDFDFRYEWKAEKGANSGVIYRSREDFGYAWVSGIEMQILDNDRHPDGGNPVTSAGSAYALFPVVSWAARPAGEWNSARIVARGNKITQYLNGRITAEFEIGSDEFKRAVAASKFRDAENYAKFPDGFIVLQDHGDSVTFRRLRIQALPK